MLRQQHLGRQRSAGRPRSAADGCVRTLFGIVVMAVIVSVVAVLLLTHPF